MKFTTIMILIVMVIFGCTKNDLILIDIEEVLSDLKDGRTTLNQLEFDVSDCLYLDSSLQHSIRSLDKSFLGTQKFSISSYLFDWKDGKKISLRSDYEAVRDLINEPNLELSSYLKDQFGLNDMKKDLSDPVLVYKKRAFIKFSQDFSSSGYLIELTESNEVIIWVVYISID